MTFQPVFDCIIPENKLQLYSLVNNTNLAAIYILEKKLDSFDWWFLSRNTSAIDI